jgi:hypothetical protein
MPNFLIWLWWQYHGSVAKLEIIMYLLHRIFSVTVFFPLSYIFDNQFLTYILFVFFFSEKSYFYFLIKPNTTTTICDPTFFVRRIIINYALTLLYSLNERYINYLYEWAID